VRERDDVDVLVEIADRCINVARNAGIRAALGDAVAFLGFDRQVDSGWFDAVVDGLTNAHAVTGPTRYGGDDDRTEPERRTIAGRDVTYFSGDNVAFRTATLRDALNGFDEYLRTGGARDAAHRLAGAGYGVNWQAGMVTRREQTDDGDPGPAPMGPEEDSREWKYRALSYRLLKNYGLRPTVVRRTLAHAAADAADAARAVLRGEGTPSAWFGSGRDVLTGIARGSSDGLVARARDRSDARNPEGLTQRSDRAVATYDWR
jgi:hypothetical protein